MAAEVANVCLENLISPWVGRCHDGAPLRRVVVATVDGRAFYVFVSMLKDLGIPFSAHLPWEQFRASLVLTTRDEARAGWGSKVLLYEDLTGDRLVDSALVLSSVNGGKDDLVVGLDPGNRIGVVVQYGGTIVHEGVCRSPREVASILRRLLALRARTRVVKLGFGDPERAMAIVKEVRELLEKGYELQLVDERNTTHSGARARRDVEAALRISRRRGVPSTF